MKNLILNTNIIKEYSKKYDANYQNNPDSIIENDLRNWFSKHNYLDKKHFIKLGLWKSKRPKKQYESNSDELIKEITKFSISSKNEEVKIKSLFVLRGVSWPVASVILHFANPDMYPIMDFRAIWSLGWNQPNSYTFEFWQKYCNEIRDLSKKLDLSIRTIDKALWQYSKENQRNK